MFLTELADIGDRIGVNLWEFEFRGRSLRSALSKLLSQVADCEGFEHGTHPLTATDVSVAIFPAFRRAGLRFKEPEYELVISQLTKRFGIDQSDLLPGFNALFPPISVPGPTVGYECARTDST